MIFQYNPLFLLGGGIVLKGNVTSGVTSTNQLMSPIFDEVN